jgi:hypothetical protein
MFFIFLRTSWSMRLPLSHNMHTLNGVVLLQLGSGAGAVSGSSKLAEAALPPTPQDGLALAVSAPLFPAIAQLLKNVDPNGDGNAADASVRLALDEALAALEAFLADPVKCPGPYLCGGQPGLADCNVATKLFLVDVAAKHFKDYTLDAGRLPR